LFPPDVLEWLSLNDLLRDFLRRREGGRINAFGQRSPGDKPNGRLGPFGVNEKRLLCRALSPVFQSSAPYSK
jgi:hypothetical protein